MSILDNLQSLPVDGLPEIFPAGVADKDKARQLAEDRKHVRRTDRAVMLDATTPYQCDRAYRQTARGRRSVPHDHGKTVQHDAHHPGDVEAIGAGDD